MCHSTVPGPLAWDAAELDRSTWVSGLQAHVTLRYPVLGEVWGDSGLDAPGGMPTGGMPTRKTSVSLTEEAIAAASTAADSADMSVSSWLSRAAIEQA